MQNDVAKDDLNNKVIAMFKHVAATRYGFSPHTHYEKYRKVAYAATECLKVSQVFTDIKEGLAMACQENPNWFPAPQFIINKVTEVKARRLRENVKVDHKLQEGSVQTINRAKVKTNYIEKIKASGVTWCENQWIASEKLPDNNFMRLDFWAAVSRQDEKAMAIINSYEKRSNRERD
jgi:hypothetical protein